MGATLSPLRLGESLRNVGAEFVSEGTESEEVSKLPSEEVEVSEQSLEGVLDKGSEWRECTVVFGTVLWISLIFHYICTLSDPSSGVPLLRPAS